MTPRFVQSLATIGTLAAFIGCAANSDLVRMKSRLDAVESGQKKLEKRVAQLDSVNRTHSQALKNLRAGRNAITAADLPEPRPPELHADGPRVDSLPVGPAYPDKPAKKRRAPAPARIAEASPTALYEQGYQAFKGKKYALSGEKLRAFVAEQPRHQWADNALFWIGQGYYDQRKYGQAREEFEKVTSLYPRGDRAPAALYRAGLCHLELKEKAAAQAAWKRLIKQYPKSPEAAQARKRMKSQNR